jgi:PAS domain S-box-containing protein
MNPSLAHSPNEATRATSYFDALEQQQETHGSSPPKPPSLPDQVNSEHLISPSQLVQSLPNYDFQEEVAGPRQRLGKCDESVPQSLGGAVIEGVVPVELPFDLKRRGMARDIVVGGPGNPRQPKVDRCSPIPEEGPILGQILPEVVSPASGLESASSESNKTVKWSLFPHSPGSHEASTPSYPFPPINPALGASSETLAHALHRPFTALSPTIPPSQVRAGEIHASKGRNSTRRGMSAGPKVLPSFGGPGTIHMAPEQRLDLYEIMLKLQCEPGLEKWWENVSKVLRWDFEANRATLAVPSDSTDVENVPWAQMATFNAAIDDPFSSGATRELQSTQSDYTYPSLYDDETAEASPKSQEKLVDPSSFGTFDTTISRPRLESRHSFAGFPQDLESMTQGNKQSLTASLSRPTALRASSNILLRGGLPTAHESFQGTKLSSESLEQHMEQVDKASQVPDPLEKGERHFPATILPVLQMLEMESDPLLNSAGAVRVLERGKLVHITREYEDIAEPIEYETSGRRVKRFGHRTSWPTPGGNGNQLGTDTSDRISRSGSFLEAQPMTPPRSHAGGSSRSIQESASKKEERAERTSHASPYEDYEQTPPSPWSQSPAPSSAIQKNPEVNPFFVDLLVDEEAFAENPPPHDYTSAPIESIGIDRASSIVHVPLVHPLMSKPKRQLRLKELSGSRSKKQYAQAGASPSIRGSHHQQSSSDDDRKTPIAILSVMSSLVPYPPSLSASLKLLAPHLATSFYNARQHTDLEKQLAGVSRHKSGPAVDSERRGSNQQSELITLDILSPPSTESINSTSENSITSMHSSHGSSVGTPGRDSAGAILWDDPAFYKYQPDLNPEISDNYFGPRKRYSSRQATSGTIATSTNPTTLNIETSSAFADAELAHMELLRPDRQASETQPEDQKSVMQRTIEAGESSRGDASSNLEYYPEHVHTETSSKGKERSHHHKKQLHTNGANFVATNPSLPAAAAKLHPDAPGGDRRSPREEDFTFRPPTSSMMRIMIDSGAIQEFIAEPETGKLNWANSRFQTYRNESAAQIRQKPWAAIHHDDQRPFHKLWRKALRTGDQVSYQARLRRFDGQYRWFHIRIVPIKNSYSSIKHWHGQAMDIHEQHTAEVNAAREKEKAASESKYRSLANSNPHIIFAASVPEGMTFANTQWLSYSGQDFDQALGFGFLDHVHPEDIVKCQFPAFKNASLPPKPPTSGLTDYTRQEGSSSSGHLSDVSAATDETTKAKVSVTLDEGTLEDAEVLAPSGLLRDLAAKGIIKASKDGQGRLSITTEMRLRAKSDQYRWHLVQGSLIESVNFGKGEAQWIIACADISDQKLIEEKLKDANTTLESETTRKMQFLSTMSHEIRTPLNGIIGNLQFLLNSNLDDYQSEWTYGADAAARGMHDLINDILDVSKAEAKMLTLYYDWFHIRSIIEDVFETLASKANEKRLELCYFVEKQVPSYVKGDAGRIRQVLLNLVSNAIKFTQRGEIFVNCTVKKSLAEESKMLTELEEIDLSFSIQDTGSGFTEEDAKILFRPYSQIDNSSTRTNGGTGLGLLLCKQMVELHHGTISATSTPGRGSTFTFTARFKLPTAKDRPKIPHHTSSESGSTREKMHFFGRGFVASPGELSVGDDTPTVSSGSSELSGTSSVRAAARSMRSSASSMDSIGRIASMNLSLPSRQLSIDKADTSESIPASMAEVLHPPMYSILIVCPQEHTRRTTEAHIQQILPKSIPAQLATSGDIVASNNMISGEQPINFTHVVLQLNDTIPILAFMDLIFNSKKFPHTCIVVITDQGQQAGIMQGSPAFNYDLLRASRRLHFLLKPSKPPKFAKIFDPRQESDLSRDLSRANRVENVGIQKKAFKKFEDTLGDRGIKVLAVEDNKLNMKVRQEKWNRIEA